MKALLLKEYRQNHLLPWTGLLVSVTLIVLSALWMYAYAQNQQDQTDLEHVCARLVVLGSGVMVIVIASGLVSSETGTGALTYLLGLPISRSRIWLAKVIAGLTLGGAAVLLLAVPISLALPGVARNVGVGFVLYLPDMAALGLAVFAVTLLCSTLLARTLTVLLVAPIVVICLGLAASLAVLMGLAPLQYDRNLADLSLWALVLSVPFLLASWVTFSRGELLDSRRKWLLALPVLLAGLSCAWLLMAGLTSWQQRYLRGAATAISDVYISPRGDLAAIYVKGNPAPFVRDQRHGWSTTGGRLRSSHTVVVDLATGREQAVWPGERPLSFLPDGRRAIVGTPPGPFNSRGRPRVWDLATDRPLSEGAFADPTRERGESLSAPPHTPWSPDGKWLFYLGGQKVTRQGFPYGQEMMTLRADGSQRLRMTIWEAGQEPKLGPGGRPIKPSTAISAWVWGRDDTLYLLTRGGELSRYSPRDGARTVIWHAPPARKREDAVWWEHRMSVSPDGRRLALRTLNRQPGEQHAGNIETWVFAIEGARVVPRANFADNDFVQPMRWSPDSRVLYLGYDLRWQEGQAGPTPIRLPAGAGEHPMEVRALPFGHELAIQDRGKAYVADARGTARPLPAIYPKTFSSDRIVGVDAEGRLVLARQPASLALLDPRTGDVRRVYP